MKKSSSVVASVAVVALGLLAAAWLATSKPQPQPQEHAPEPPPQVEVLAVRPQDLQVEVRSQGTVRPRRQIDLVAQVGGLVTEVSDAFVEGGVFPAGAVLLHIDAQDYEIALVRAEARLADARQALATERGRAREAERQWRELGDADANALFLRKPQLASAEAQVRAAQADVREARLDLERTQIRAPFAGRVADVQADLGQHVGAGAAVATIFAADRVEVALPVTEAQLALLDLDELDAGLPVTLQVGRAGEAARWPAQIRRSAAQLDSETRLLDLIAEVDEPFGPGHDMPLLVGRFVAARIQGRTVSAAARLPAAALRPGERIWVLRDGQLRIEAVELLQGDDSQVLVRFADATPRQVVISYLAQARDGMTLTVAQAGAGS